MDDIVEQLRAIGDELSEDYYPTVYAAAHEIERLSEVALAADEYHDVLCNPKWCRLCRALNAWKEARRG